MVRKLQPGHMGRLLAKKERQTLQQHYRPGQHRQPALLRQCGGRIQQPTDEILLRLPPYARERLAHR